MDDTPQAGETEGSLPDRHEGPCYPNWPSTSGAFARHRPTAIGDCSRCGMTLSGSSGAPGGE